MAVVHIVLGSQRYALVSPGDHTFRSALVQQGYVEVAPDAAHELLHGIQAEQPTAAALDQLGLSLKGPSRALSAPPPVHVLRARHPNYAPTRSSTQEDTVEQTQDAQDEKAWFEVLLVDADEQPMSGVRFEVTLSDGSTRRGRTNSAGIARLERLPDGSCKFGLVDLDESRWEPA